MNFPVKGGTHHWFHLRSIHKTIFALFGAKKYFRFGTGKDEIFVVYQEGLVFSGSPP